MEYLGFFGDFCLDLDTFCHVTQKLEFDSKINIQQGAVQVPFWVLVDKLRWVIIQVAVK